MDKKTKAAQRQQVALKMKSERILRKMARRMEEMMKDMEKMVKEMELEKEE